MVICTTYRTNRYCLLILVGQDGMGERFYELAVGYLDSSYAWETLRTRQQFRTLALARAHADANHAQLLAAHGS